MNWNIFNKNIVLYLGLLSFVVAAVPTFAQDDDDDGASITDLSNAYDFKTLGGMQGRLAPHGNDLMGDMIDKKTGSITLEHTDISIPGNSGLEVALRRKLTQGSKLYTPHQQAFGDWVLDLPIAYISYGYDIHTPLPEFDDGCLQSRVGDRDIVNGAYFISGVNTDGSILHVPGKGLSGFQGKQWSKLNGIQDPKADWVSGGRETDYDGRCAEVTIAPDGTKYKFGRHTIRRAKIITAAYQGRPIGEYALRPWIWAGLERKAAVLLITEVEDIHGNWVRYEYTDDAELTKIVSNDEREIALHYDDVDTGNRNSHRVTHITAHGRQWDYEYSGEPNDTYRILHKVILPDDRYWDFSLDEYPMRAMLFDPYFIRNCVPNDETFSIKHPDGAIGTFTLRETRHLKSATSLTGFGDFKIVPRNVGPPDVTSNCYAGQEPLEGSPYYQVISLVEKKISGENIPESTWTFEYRGYDDGGENDDWRNVDDTWSKITEPDGTSRTYTYQAIGRDHGLLKRIDVTSPSGAEETFEYDYDVSLIRHVDCEAGGEYGDTSGACLIYNKRPVTKKTHIRDGVTYNTDTAYNKPSFSNLFIDHGRPNKITRYSSLKPDEKRITDIEYWHNTAANIIGLPERVLKNDKEFVSYHYNSKGQAEYVNKFSERWDSFTYHPDGQVHTITDPLENTATLTDYHRGQPRNITRRDGTTLERTIDDNGWVTSETNGRGFTTTYGYNDNGWMERITPPSPWEETNITYHNLGTENFYRSIRMGTKQTIEWYDAMLRLRREGQEAFSGGGLSTYTTTDYDALGRVTFTSLPSYSLTPTEGTSITYDGLGRVTGTTENFGLGATTTTAYLSNNRVSTTDAEGNETIVTRSGYGSPNDGETTLIQQPEYVITGMTHDIYGNILTANQFFDEDQDNVTSTQTWKYNDRLQPCIHHVPETGYKAFLYDDLDQVNSYGEGLTGVSIDDDCPSTIQASSRITMGYDEVGRIENINYPDTTPDVTIEYDANGNVKRNERGSTIWQFAYDNADHLEEEILSIDGRSYALNYFYNTMGNINSRILPSGRVVEFGYNGLSQVTSVESDGEYYASNMEYHVNGLIENIRYGNGHTFTQSINGSQQPERLSTKLSFATAMDLHYTYDARRNVTQIIDWADRSRDRNMTYDDLGRLKTANGIWGSGTFYYDELGNLTRKVLGSRTVNVSYDDTTNRATQSTDTAGSTRAIEYDTRGNVKTLGALNFVYDKSNQPTQLTGSSNGTYTYDGKFKRVKVDVDGKVIYNVFDASGALVHVDKVSGTTTNIPVCFTDCSTVAVSGSQTTDYIKAGSLSIRLENDEPTYLHNDLLGSPVAGTDKFGNVIWQEHYTPYGEKIRNSAANDDLGSFTGHIDDSSTGLTYMQARYYDPVVGRFLANDPVGFLGHLGSTQGPQGFNRYAYVNNNPMGNTDPDGRLCVPCAAGAIVGAALDIATQGAVIAFTDATISDFSVSSVVISGIAGATGAGMASNIAKLGVTARGAAAGMNATSDAVISVGSTLAKGGDLTATGVAIDVIAGQTAGNLAGNTASKATSGTASQKIATNTASRAARIAAKPGSRRAQQNRALSTAASAREAPAEASAIGGTIGSNAASSLTKSACESNGMSC